MWLYISPEIINVHWPNISTKQNSLPSALSNTQAYAVPTTTTLGGSQRFVPTVHATNDGHVYNYPSSWIFTRTSSAWWAMSHNYKWNPYLSSIAYSISVLVSRLILKISSYQSINQTLAPVANWRRSSFKLDWNPFSISGIETGISYSHSLNITNSLSVHPHYQIPFANTLHSECNRLNNVACQHYY